MKSYSQKCFLTTVFTVLSALNAFSQTPTPPPIEEPIKVFTEEVHLNVTAQTAFGNFVPTLKADDLLIVEDGTPQTVESMKKVPASVLFLLDTGGNLNFAKSLDAMRVTAKLLTAKLSAEHTLAVLQSYDKIETVSDWTRDQAVVQDDLTKKLFSGNRSRFTDSVNAAIEMFTSRPFENRHLIFIGDALDTFASPEMRETALQDLLAANITVHVLAFNKMQAGGVDQATRKYQWGEKNVRPRVPEYILENMLRGLPVEVQIHVRTMYNAHRIFTIRLDREAIKLAKEKRELWRKAETEIQTAAEDSGGMFQSPEELATMWQFAAEIAKTIDSQYVITYIPTKSFAESENGETRKIRVSTHCSGVQIRSRLKMVVKKTEQ